MSPQDLRQQMLDYVERELMGVGCVVEDNYREQMARILDRIDQVTTREDAEALFDELRHERRDPRAAMVCSPAVWLHAVECA